MQAERLSMEGILLLEELGDLLLLLINLGLLFGNIPLPIEYFEILHNRKGTHISSKLRTSPWIWSTSAFIARYSSMSLPCFCKRQNEKALTERDVLIAGAVSPGSEREVDQYALHGETQMALKT